VEVEGSSNPPALSVGHAPVQVNPVPVADLSAALAHAVAQRVGVAQFERYFGTAGRPAASAFEVGPEGVDVRVPSAFLAQLLARRFRAVLVGAATATLGLAEPVVKFKIEAEGAAPAGAATASRQADPAPAAARGAGRGSAAARAGGLSHHRGSLAAARAETASRLRFDLGGFEAGAGNRLALESALRLARGELGAGARLLYVHGPCGTGKTHLAQGVAAMIRQREPVATVRAVTAEAFANEYIGAVRGKRVEAFHRAYRTADVLIIDDLAALADKEGTQLELQRTLDAVLSRGGRVMVCGPAGPKRVRGLSEALVSRLSAGMCVGLELPDAALRDRLVRTLAGRRGLVLDDAAVKAVAGSAGPAGSAGLSVRDLEGLVIKVEAVHRLLDVQGGGRGGVGLGTVQQALGARNPRPGANAETGAASGAGTAGSGLGLPPGLRRPIRFQVILETVCRDVGAEIHEVMGSSRQPAVVLARSMSAYIARRLTGLSYPEIARFLGRSNHSTVITACQRIDRQMAEQAIAPARGEREPETLQALCDRLTRTLRQSE
jgi:chromosomal replication initiator protein